MLGQKCCFIPRQRSLVECWTVNNQLDCHGGSMEPLELYLDLPLSSVTLLTAHLIILSRDCCLALFSIETYSCINCLNIVDMLILLRGIIYWLVISLICPLCLSLSLLMLLRDFLLIAYSLSRHLLVSSRYFYLLPYSCSAGISCSHFFLCKSRHCCSFSQPFLPLV